MSDTATAAPGAAETSAITAEDLNLIDPRLADTTKDEAEIWNELQEEETARAAGQDRVAASHVDDTREPEGAGASKATPAADPTPATPAQAGGADIWASATPEQKAAYEAERQRYRSSIGRISALTRKLNAQNAAQPSREYSQARDHIAGIRNDYPELAQPLEKALGTIDTKLDQIARAEQTTRDAEVNELNDLVAAETRRLLTKHPDYETVLKQHGQAFAAWVEDQPRNIREAAHRNGNFIADSEEAGAVIEGFKKHIGLIAEPARPAVQPAPQPVLTDRRQRQIEASASPQRSGGRPTISGIPESGDPQAIWDAFDAQDRARA